MGKGNIPFLAFNRGILSPQSLGRVDLDRTKLSAEVMTNWLPKTQGAMRIRPGTKYMASSLNDTGAGWIEFVASTDDVALLEMTADKMRIWLGSDSHNLALLGRPLVATTVSINDTGWVDASEGGSEAGEASDMIPNMTAFTTDGVKMSASYTGDTGNFPVWQLGDDDPETWWNDTGRTSGFVDSWVNVDFDGDETGDTGLMRSVNSYKIQAISNPFLLTPPKSWRLITGNHDTGTYATDTGKWTLEDERSGIDGWSVSETRSYDLPAADTGTIEARRHWRLYMTEPQTGFFGIWMAKIQMLPAASSSQVIFNAGSLTLDAGAVKSFARTRKRVIVDTGDAEVEHSLDMHVSRGPITIRVGSSSGDDDYVSESSLGTGRHNLAFTPSTEFHITLQTSEHLSRILSALAVGDSGTVELTTPWGANDVDNIRYDQSADVVYLDTQNVRQQKVERRGTGRSWSVVDYAPRTGPFLPSPASSAKLRVDELAGNTRMRADIPVFSATHVGSLVRMFTNGQSGIWALGDSGATTDAIEVTGIGDTGAATSTNERRITVIGSGTYTGGITVERSFDAADRGFKEVTANIGDATDSGTFSINYDDTEDNIKVWYRARLSSYTSGAAIIQINYDGGGQTGIGRITAFNSNQDVNLEVLRRFSDSGESSNWQLGYWSQARGFPTAVSLHGGRLFHAQGGSIFGSVADDYESFDEEVEGDAGPIIRTLGSGPVDSIFYLISLLRLIIGTAGAELALRSSSLDEPVTPDNSNARTFSTQGSLNLRAVKLDTNAVFVQRSGARVFLAGFGLKGDVLGDYAALELTLLVPELLTAGVVSLAIQRQPDTRVHCVLGNGTVAILTYEADEEVLAWSTWETDGTVEKAMVLPGTEEDAVFYHIKRTINGSEKRFLEKWAMESESYGDTGLSWLADSAVSFTDTGRATDAQGFDHLIGESVIVWADDTGQTDAGKDLSFDTGGVQTTYTVDTGGNITLPEAVHHAVAGLPYTADYRSTKLAFGAEAGTALAQMKRTDKIAFVLYKTHNNGLFFGTDTGELDPLPRMTDEGGLVDSDKIFVNFDQVAMAFPGLWDEDSRMHLRAKAPRPVTVIAAVPTVQTNEKV